MVMPHLVGVLVTTSFYSKERQKLQTPLQLDLSQHGLARDRCWSCLSPPCMPYPLPYLFIYLFIYQHVLMCVIMVTLFAFHLSPYRLAQAKEPTAQSLAC